MNTHTFRLALYDPSTLQGNDYWTWYNKDLPPNELRLCYHDLLKRHFPPTAELQKLSTDDIWGGYVHFHQWVVIYRYFHGGYDAMGRPGRYVVLTAWIPREEIHNISALRDMLTSVYFQRYADSIPPRPVPEPGSLQVMIQSHDTVVAAQGLQTHPGHATQYAGNDVFHRGLSDFFYSRDNAHLIIEKTADRFLGRMELSTPPPDTRSVENAPGKTPVPEKKDHSMLKNNFFLLLPLLAVVCCFIYFYPSFTGGVNNLPKSGQGTSTSSAKQEFDADAVISASKSYREELEEDQHQLKNGRITTQDFLKKYPEIKRRLPE